MHEVDDYPAPTWRRRLLLLCCALATVYLIMSHVLARPGNPDFKPAPPPDKALCTPGQSTGCVGGMASVIVTPALSTPSADQPAAQAASAPSGR